MLTLFFASDVISAAIKKLIVQQQNSKFVNKLESSWVKPIQVIPEPYFCSSLQNLFLYFPGKCFLE